MTSSALPRHIPHPGPAAEERIVSAVGALEVLDFTLQPGLTVNAAIAGPLLEAGFEAAQVEISGGGFGPFTYVMPAKSPDADHVAWYSAAFTPPGTSRLESGCVTFGRREGAPFIHCHAFWIEADGTRHGGHVMPHEAIVAEPITARAYGSRNVGIAVDFDPETNFSLFAPHALSGVAAGEKRIAFARLRPNIDFCRALEEICRRHGFAAGRVCGGVGSLIGARFTDAPEMSDYATEVFVRAGTIVPDATGALKATADVSLVSLTGALAAGRLVRGDNPVLITFEVAVEETTP